MRVINALRVPTVCIGKGDATYRKVRLFFFGELFHCRGVRDFAFVS